MGRARKKGEKMRILKELIAIKKELQDIKLILKFQFLSNYKTTKEVIDGEMVTTRRILPDPLEELRKEEYILQQSRKSGVYNPVVVRRKLKK